MALGKSQTPAVEGQIRASGPPVRPGGAVSSARRRGRVVGPTRGVAATLKCQTRRWSLARLSEQATPEQDETPAMWPEPGIDPGSSLSMLAKVHQDASPHSPRGLRAVAGIAHSRAPRVLPGGGAGRPRRSLCALRVKHRPRGGGTVPLRNRAAHHEPLHRRSLDADLNRSLELVRAIHPTAGDWVATKEQLGNALTLRPSLGGR